jgi:diguanylate cyclase (GGDEF)-like protein
MKKRSLNFCNFTTLLSICLIIYIVINTYIDHFYSNNTNADNTLFIIKITSLSILFVVIAFLFTFFKIYKKSYLEKEIKQRTEDIVHENQTLKIYSHIDPLTQCLNKKYFIQRFESEFKRAIRDKQYISLLIVNIDEFKAFNDIYGEKEGDECIKLIANILVNHCNRPTDLIARFNEDEFYILLPNTKEAVQVAKKCVDSVKSLQIPHENSIASNVLTISVGVSSILPTSIKQKNELVNQVKSALSSAKRSGRNRVNFYN